MTFITIEGFRNLDDYKYHSGGYSFLDKIINYYWEFVVSLMPKWLAPNLITFTGFILMIISFVIMLPYDQKLSKDIPCWTFYVAALFQFLYQTLDAIDGKQARRIKLSTPLGQLFDHGCDSFSVTFLVLTVAEAAKFGSDKDSLFALTSTVYFCFWISNWSEYHTKVLRTHMFNFGVTEGELTIIGVLLISAIWGQNAWLTPMSAFIPSVVANHLPDIDFLNVALKTPVKFYVLYGLIGAFLSLASFAFLSTVKSAKKKMEAVLQNVPVILLFILNYLWKDTKVYSTSRSLVSLIFGLNFSLFTCRLIVCSLTQMKFPWFHRELVFFSFMTAVLRRDLFFPKVKLGFDVEYIVLVTSLIFTVLSTVQWSVQVVNEITSHLGIYCFTLKQRPDLKKLH